MPAIKYIRGHGPLLQYSRSDIFFILLMSQLREHNDQARFNQRFQ